MVFQRISTWLANCLENHPECRVNEPDILARQVIDVSYDGKGLLFDEVLLINATEKHPQSAPYAALSYCWGNDLNDVTMATKATLNNFLNEGIELKSLQKSIYDAVVICQRLNIPYL